MNSCRLWFVQVLLCLLLAGNAWAQTSPASHPGIAPYIPTRMDWLNTVLATQLNADHINDDGYMLIISEKDPETVLIFVRYLPSVNREAMNTAIDTARKVIHITAKSYGWDSWVKIREKVEMAKSGH
jgi:hypothetical protein